MTFIVFLFSAAFVYCDGPIPLDAGERERNGLGQALRAIYERPKNQKVPLQISVNKRLIQDSENEEVEELEEELQELIEEMKKLGKEAREKFRKEILPGIKEEMEKLREKLRKWQDEEDESEPTEVEGVEI